MHEGGMKSGEEIREAGPQTSRVQGKVFLKKEKKKKKSQWKMNILFC